jgi:hypothetical protein
MNVSNNFSFRHNCPHKHKGCRTNILSSVLSFFFLFLFMCKKYFSHVGTTAHKDTRNGRHGVNQEPFDVGRTLSLQVPVYCIRTGLYCIAWLNMEANVYFHLSANEGALLVRIAGAVWLVRWSTCVFVSVKLWDPLSIALPLRDTYPWTSSQVCIQSCLRFWIFRSICRKNCEMFLWS